MMLIIIDNRELVTFVVTATLHWLLISPLKSGGHTRANRDLAQKYAKILRDRRLIRSRRMPMDCDPIPAAVVKEAPNESPVKTEPTSESQVKVEPREDDAEELSLLKLLEADKVPDIIGGY